MKGTLCLCNEVPEAWRTHDVTGKEKLRDVFSTETAGFDLNHSKGEGFQNRIGQTNLTGKVFF